MGIIGNTNAAGFRNGFEACRYVDAVAEDVTVIFYDITDINTDPELNSLVRRYV